MFQSVPQGRTFLITGASRGIGRQLAIDLAKKQKTLVLVARNQSLLDELALLLQQYRVRVYTISFDVTSFEEYDSLLERATQLAGKIDTIVLNAGVLYKNPVGKAFQDDKKVVETNLLSVMACVNAFVPYAKSISAPHLVVISSVLSDFQIPKVGAYCASKSGLNAYLDALRLECPQLSITNIKPGLVSTDMGKSASDDMSAAISVEECVNGCMAAIEKRSANAYVPWMYTIVLPVFQWVPFKALFLK